MLSHLSRINLAGSVYSILISHVGDGDPACDGPDPGSAWARWDASLEEAAWNLRTLR